jgi:hypothetical protein
MGTGGRGMNTIEPEKLKRVVQILAEKKPEIDSYFDAYIYRPYNIDIKNVISQEKMEDAKRLFDFSFDTRQGGQNNKALKAYAEGYEKVIEKIGMVIGLLANDGLPPRNRYELSLALINGIEGVGQKIASMYIKFLVYYGEGFQGKEELERELFIPLDAHVLRLLYKKHDGKENNRLNLYDEKINSSYLKYEYDTANMTLAENNTVKLQRKIRQDFDDLKIEEPPIILDHLWYAGYMYCNRRFGDIGCKTCFLKDPCLKGDRG